MTEFAVAFTTTGNSPKAGHRFNEIILIGQENGVRNGQFAVFKLNVDSASNQGMPFPEALARMKGMIGDAKVIVHHAGIWRRFLRVELRSIKRHGASHLMRNVIDVHAWAHQRFPRQRNNVVALAKKSGIEIPAELTGLDLEVELLRQIANLMHVPAKTIPVVAEPKPVSLVPEVQAIPQASQRSWTEQVGKFWRNLGRRA